MIKVLLVYFSGTGMTRYFTTLIQAEMVKRGYSCDIADLEELVDMPTLWQKKPVALRYTIRAEEKRPLGKYPWPYLDLNTALNSAKPNQSLNKLIKKWTDYDLIGFGSPVYAFRPAPVMIRFLLDLPFFDKKVRAFSYATHDGAQGDYEPFMKSLLKTKGFKYVGHLDQTFINSALAVMLKNFDHLKTGRLLAEKSFRARKNIFLFLEYIHSLFYGIPFKYRSANPVEKIFGIPYRFVYSYGIDFLLNNFLFGFGIHKENCILCMTCVQQCPQGLIELDDDGYPIRHYHCMYCLRCLNWCPTDALYFSPLTDGKARFPGPETLLEAVHQDNLSRRIDLEE